MPRPSTASVTARLERVKALVTDLPALFDSNAPVAHATAERIRREIEAVLRTLRQPNAPTATIASVDVGRVGAEQLRDLFRVVADDMAEIQKLSLVVAENRRGGSGRASSAASNGRNHRSHKI
jgi:hypothetical protein